MCVRACVRACVCTHVSVCVRAHVSVCAHVCIYMAGQVGIMSVCVYVCLYIFICMYVCVCAHVCKVMMATIDVCHFNNYVLYCLLQGFCVVLVVITIDITTKY